MLLGKRVYPLCFEGIPFLKIGSTRFPSRVYLFFLPGILKVGLNGMSVGWDEKVARISSWGYPRFTLWDI